MTWIASEGDSYYSEVAEATIPAGASEGDRLVAFLTVRTNNPSVPVPTGWTRFIDNEAAPCVGNGYTHAYTAVATSGGDADPGSTLAIALPVNSPWCLSVHAFSPGDVIAFASGEPGGTSGGGSTVTTPSLTAEGAATLIHAYGDLGTESPGVNPITWTAHASTTERTDLSVDIGGGRWPTQLVATEDIASAGATPARTATPSQNVIYRGMAVLVGTSIARPVADAGEDQTVQSGETVTLTGSATDGGGAGPPYAAQWTQVSGTPATLSDDTAASPTFTAPSGSDTLVFSLVMTDSAEVASEPDTVTITVVGPGEVAVPNADVTVDGWTPSIGSTIWEVLSDNKDSTYAISPENPINVELRVGLSVLQDGTSNDTVTLSFRARMTDGTSGTITGQLVEGASTVIATLLNEPLTSNWKQFDLQFTPAEIEDVSDWGDVDFVAFTTAE